MRLQDLSVVGNISGVYKKTMPNAAEIPNFPIMLNAVLTGTSDTFSPVQKMKHAKCAQSLHIDNHHIEKLSEARIIRRSMIVNALMNENVIRDAIVS